MAHQIKSLKLKILKHFTIFILAYAFNAEAGQTTTFIIKSYPLTVDGKKAAAFRIEQPDGTWGYHGVKGQYFDAIVKNQTDVPTAIHWHGLMVPNNQDGVPDVTQPLIPPGGQYHYHFKLLQSGTYWMHSHYDLQIQQFLSAPFIIRDPNEKQDAKEVIMFLSDYSQKSPQKIMRELHSMGSMADMPSMQPDLNDVTYDAYLTNYRTLQNPEIVNVTPGETVRLRIIDGSAATNFFVNTSQLPGQAIAVDGESIKPLAGTKFQLAIGQRIDILVKIPQGEGVYPILAQGEGSRLQTGLILKTKNATLSPINETAPKAAEALNYAQELKIKAMHPLPVKPVVQTISAKLEGDMQHYVWKINNQVWPRITPLSIGPNQRIEMVFINQTSMAHPMHLHGHVFEVTKINGQPINDGALHDTVLVLPHTSLSVQFDSNNMGNWMLHCHMLYHQESGMMTIIHYVGFEHPILDHSMTM
jgi:FtsP/CotA-like multicopper oxidase with cupredoxin domain